MPRTGEPEWQLTVVAPESPAVTFPPDIGDAELVAACLAGQPGAFDLVVERHQRVVYQLCYRFVANHEDASDLTQDVFLRAYRGLRNFRGQSSLGTWLYRIGVNVCLNRLSVKAPHTEPIEDRQHVDMTLAIYPGSFDPLTNGHVDIISRGARLFDRIVVAILVNAEKAPLFSMAERVEIAQAVFEDLPNVEVDTFEGLLVDYVERRNAQVIVRGLRAISDFEFEFQMALMNRRLNGKIETVFMMPAEQYSYISSRLIKEVFSLGGEVHGLVPDMVEERLRRKVGRQ